MAVQLKEERPGKGVVVLYVGGRRDAAAVSDFEAEVLPPAAEDTVTRLVLAGADLEYVASAGLRVLVKVVKAMSGRKARLYAAEWRPETLAVLKMTGFLSFLDVKATVAECLA
ncbi:MAG: STAS domain-containing protein [Planctomycetes bacterium]|nr:STAS domain-containing protein [Planctomycetota bacterium]